MGVAQTNTQEEGGYAGEHEPLPPLTVALATLASLGKRPEGWDGEDAVLPARKTVTTARQWLTSLSRAVAQAHQPWLEPHVAATPDGDVLFEWWVKERKLSVYVTDEVAEYIQTWKEAGAIHQEDGDAQGAEIQARIWSWLIG